MGRLPRALTAKPPSFLSLSSGFVVECSPAVFRFAWSSIFILHLAHAGVLLRGTYAQIRTLRSPDEASASFRATGLRFEPRFYYMAIVLGVIFSLYHLHSVVSLVRYSLRARQLSLVSPEPDASSGRSRLRDSLQSFSDTLERKFSKLSTTLRRLIFFYGIRGPRFELAFHAKEMYEIFWETLQLYQSLYSVVHPSIGYLSLAVLVLNCWSTPAVYLWFPHPTTHRAARVVLCLAVDVLLDFTSSVTIPALVYAHYRALLAHPKSYDAVWTFTAGTDLVQFAPNSFLSVMAHLLPSISMVTNLLAIKPVIKRWKNGFSHSQLIAIAPATTQSSPTAPQVNMKSILLTRPVRQRWIKTLHGLFFFIALSAIVIIGSARHDAAAEGLPGCRQVWRHWLVRRVPCAVLEIDCRSHGFSGDSNLDHLRILERADRNALRALTFVHCDALIVPTAIREFPKLHWFEIRDSTLVSWSTEAAPTRHTTPHLDHVLLLRTRLGSFPAALITRELPHTMMDVTIANSNLTDLPFDLHTVWPQPMASVILERCGFDVVPSTLLEMHVDALSLAGNAIATVPLSFLDGKTFTLLSLAGNPIMQLPAELPRGFTLRRSLAETKARGLWLAGTRVAVLPRWLRAPSRCLAGDVYAQDTPLCEPAPADEPSECVENRRALHCDARSAPGVAISSDGFLAPTA